MRVTIGKLSPGAWRKLLIFPAVRIAAIMVFFNAEIVTKCHVTALKTNRKNVRGVMIN